MNLEDTTFLIKTIDRPDCLKRLLDSIDQFYPNVKVIIADDGETPGVEFERANTIYDNLPYDVGLSAGRNHLVERAETPYVLMLDDDFVFTEKTRIEHLVFYLKADVFDICGGAVRESAGIKHFEGFIELNRGVLKRTHKRLSAPGYVDIIPNFFAAKRESLSLVQWDDDLKLGEHQDFFLRAKKHNVRVGFVPTVEILHKRERPTNYAEKKNRAHGFFQLFKKKHNISDIQGSLSS